MVLTFTPALTRWEPKISLSFVVNINISQRLKKTGSRATDNKENPSRLARVVVGHASVRVTQLSSGACVFIRCWDAFARPSVVALLGTCEGTRQNLHVSHAFAGNAFGTLLTVTGPSAQPQSWTLLGAGCLPPLYVLSLAHGRAEVRVRSSRL